MILIVGPLPQPAPGFQAGGQVAVHRWFELRAGALFAPEVSSPGKPFRFGLASGEVGACAAWSRPTFVGLALCVEVLLGTVHGVALSGDRTQPGGRFWAAALMGIDLRLRLFGPVEAEAGAALLMPLVRYRFFVEGDGETIFRQTAAGLMARVGLAVHFR